MGYSLPTDALALKRVAEHLQLDIASLEQRSGINFELIEQRAWIPATRTRKLYLSIASQLHCSDFPIKIGLSFSPDTLGPLGILFLLSPTLEQGFKALENFYPLQDKNMRLEVKVEDEITIIQINVVQPIVKYLRDVIAVSAILRLVSLLRLSMGESYQPIKTCFRRGLEFKGIEQALNLECYFDCCVDAIIIPTKDMHISLQMAGETINKQIREAIRNYLVFDKELVLPLKSLIREKISEMDYNLDLAASELNISVRTLQRRLKDMDLTFSKIVQLVRLELALELFEDKKLTLADIAERLGYSDESVLSRSLIHKYGIKRSKCRNTI
ncbi:AraC family transcriptional regulator [Parashewanella tropica]|uniref:AraC family transcriptional regulator n=1 Tax=Parashewanella tropica TaxID=2547970 RepID=UPI0010596BE4|nr:AraC family transcriptional regulator [Parashewanella tropica]